MTSMDKMERMMQLAANVVKAARTHLKLHDEYETTAHYEVSYKTDEDRAADQRVWLALANTRAALAELDSEFAPKDEKA